MVVIDEKMKEETIIDNPLLFYYIFAVLVSIVSAIIFIILFIVCYKKKNKLEDNKEYDIYKETSAHVKDKKSARLLKKDGRPKRITLKGNKPNPYGFEREDPTDMPDYKCPCHIKGNKEHDPSKPFHSVAGGPTTYLVQDINKVFAIARKKRMKNPYNPYAGNPFMNAHMKNCRYKHTATYLNTYEGYKMDPSMKRCDTCNSPLDDENGPVDEKSLKKAKKKKQKKSKSDKKKSDTKITEETKEKQQMLLQREKSFCPYDQRPAPSAPPLFPPRQDSKFVNYNVRDSTITNYNKQDYQPPSSRRQSSQMSVPASCPNCQDPNYYSYMNCPYHSSIHKNPDESDKYTYQNYPSSHQSYSRMQSGQSVQCCRTCRSPLRKNSTYPSTKK